MQTKTLKFQFVVIIATIAALSVLIASAQTGDSGGVGSSSSVTSLPISSADALKSYAIEQVAKMSGYIWSPSIVNSSSTTSSFYKDYVAGTNGADLAEVFAIIGSQALSFKVANTRDACYGNLAIYNEDWDNLFYGSSYFKLVQVYPPCPAGSNCPPVWEIPPKGLDITMSMNSTIPIVVSNANWVEVIERDANGNIARYYYPEVRTSKTTGKAKVYFPVYFAGKSGEVIVNYRDGLSSVFSLSSGLLKTTATAFGNTTPAIKDTIILKSDGSSAVLIQPIGDRSPLVQLKATAYAWYSLSATAPSGEIAKGFWYRRSGSTTWTYVAVPRPPDYVPVKLEAGIYYVIPDWDTFGKNVPQEYGPPYNGPYPVTSASSAKG